MSHPSLIKVCGSCDYPDWMHSNNGDLIVQYTDGFKIECPRSYDQIGLSTWRDDKGREYSDYFMVKDPTTGDYHTVLSYDHSGSEASSGSDLIMHRDALSDPDYRLAGIGADEPKYVSVDDPAHELAKIDRWRDNAYRSTASSQTWTCTSLLGEKDGEYDLTVTVDPKTKEKSYSKEQVTGEYVSTEDRNAFVEGNEGFLSIRLLDEVLTKKYHARLLNVYRDKQNFLRVGSVRVIPLADGRIGARCVNDTCSGRLIIDPSIATRKDLEDFVYALVSHGNNHAAAWFKNRCDHNHQRNEKHTSKCTALYYELEPSLSYREVLTDEDELAFLMEHSNYCTDKACTCSALIKEKVKESLDRNHHLKVSA